ncbi:MAG TPA: glycoside hydrolase N-terminal domain-containing protein [Chitinophagaceae bacterium]|nr:glycoside hydrolase N-terminal domain-containing protein [Chitinophagaceae bacterium]
MNKKPFALIILLYALGPVKSFAQSADVLWYNHPADYFEQTLVLGNGKMGAAVFGDVTDEKIFLNDITLWSGEPVNPDNNPAAYKFVAPVRKALREENYKLADSLNKNLQGQFSQSYAPLGTVKIYFKDHHSYTNYYRELDLKNAVSKLSYEVNGVQYQREYFVSNPDRVMAIKLSASKKEAINCTVSFESLLKYVIREEKATMKVTGYAPYHAEPSYRGNMPNAVLFDESKGTRFTSLFKIKNQDGQVSFTDSTIELSGCTEAILYISIATSFNGFNKNPATEGLDDQAIALIDLKKALKKPYPTIKKTHVRDYQALYNRVELDLGTTAAPDLPTDERLLRYSEGKEDKNLEILYFNFGRYLLIASSRTNGVPANLQGIWNPYIRPPWSSNYTININLEENYWLAEIANLSELHRPLLSFINNLSQTGAITAKTYYGVNGWAAGHNSDIWAMSNPVGDFGKGDPTWANWTMGGVWLSTHLWEHYAFTHDKDFLKKTAYPIMKKAVQFCLGWMVKDKDGKWITSPGTSPENNYITAQGYRGATLYGATADLAMIRELFEDFLKASDALKIDDGFIKQVEDTHNNLHPYSIGKKGNLQEWYYDWEDSDPKHRHQTHLFGLHPGHHITPYETPDLANACRTTLEIKGDQTTGWSKGWRINLWARLWDGNRAYKMYRELLKYVDPDGMNGQRRGGGTYPNLFDAHPPFQIDGNFGGASAVIEMLMQSTGEKIFLLPALPDAWSEGNIKGICARGGFEVSMKWDNKTLKKTTLFSKTGGITTLVYNGIQKKIKLKKGETTEVNW